MNHPAQYWIDHLGLNPHPEGGFYKEIYRSDEVAERHALPHRYKGNRSFSTSIYFLLRSEDISAFHKIKSDELWFYHDGDMAEIYILKDKGTEIIRLGRNPENGETLQAVIPFGYWFGAKVVSQDSYILVSCTVAPGFDFEDFELAKQEELLALYPHSENLIKKLTV